MRCRRPRKRGFAGVDKRARLVGNDVMRYPASLALEAIAFAAERLPDEALRPLGTAAGFALSVALRNRRREAESAVMQSLGLGQDDASKVIASMFRHLGWSAVEWLRYSGHRSREFAGHVSITGGSALEAALAAGKGALILTAHIGNWELMAAAASRWGPVGCVVKPIKARGVSAFVCRRRERMGLRLYSRDGSLRPILRALARGEIVAMPLDQNMRLRRGIFVPFFGRPACTTPGLAIASALARAPVFPAYMIREETGRHQLHLESPIEPPPDLRSATIREYTARYTAVLERIIRAHPEQWLWIHRRWKTQPPSTASDPIDTPRR